MAANPIRGDDEPDVSVDERRRLIAEAAYFRALERGFAGGDALSDWLEAEKEIDARFDPLPYDVRLELLYERLARANERLRELVAAYRHDHGCLRAEELEKAHKLRNAYCERLTAMRRLTGRAEEGARREAETRWSDLVEVMEGLGASLEA